MAPTSVIDQAFALTSTKPCQQKLEVKICSTELLMVLSRNLSTPLKFVELLLCRTWRIKVRVERGGDNITAMPPRWGVASERHILVF
jgi:hypothetical protein